MYTVGINELAELVGTEVHLEVKLASELIPIQFVPSLEPSVTI